MMLTKPDCPAYRTRQKPKIDIVLVKTPEFDDIIVAESMPLSPSDDHTASADTATEIAKPSQITADGQVGPLDLLDGPSGGGPLAVPLQMAQCMQVHWKLAKGPPKTRLQHMVHSVKMILTAVIIDHSISDAEDISSPW